MSSIEPIYLIEFNHNGGNHENWSFYTNWVIVSSQQALPLA